jgi:hypothetical protein
LLPPAAIWLPNSKELARKSKFNFGVKKMRSVKRKIFMKVLLPLSDINRAAGPVYDINPQLEVIK